MEIIELLTPFYEVAWLPWAVQYFFLIGIAATAALLAGFCVFRYKTAAQQLLPATVAVLLIAAVAAPLSLLADLHQPGRFWHFYSTFTPWSWMSLGAYLLPVFVLLALLFCTAWWFGHQKTMRVIAVFLVISAISILIYTGSEVMILRSRPLWNTIFLPINFALTAMLATMGAILLISRWLPNKDLPEKLITKIIGLSFLMLFISAISWAISGLMGKDPAFPVALRIFYEFPTWRLAFLGSIAVAIAVILLLAFSRNKLLNRFYSLFMAAALLAVAWIFRWIVFMAVQEIPKYGAGLYIYQMPLGSSGLLGMLGVLGLCIALIAIVTWFLNEFRNEAHTQLN